MRTAESPPRAPPFWPPLKSEWRVWGRRLNMEKVLVVQKIGRKNEAKWLKGCGCLRLRGGGLSGGSSRGYEVGLYQLLCI